MPYVIGLTGNIACGKSAVAAMLRDRGAEIIDADKVAHQVMAPPGPVFDAIIGAFGPDILTPSGTIDRQKLGAIVFANPAALRQLDQIVHPFTSATIRRMIATSSAAVVVIEAIKLIESGTYRSCSSIWVVTCTRGQQIERLMASRGLSREQAEQRVAAQSPPAEKLAYADVIIDASGSLPDTERQVAAAWQDLIKA